MFEQCKYAQSKFMGWDKELALDPDNVKETGCTVKAGDLNDELGRVQV